MRLEDFISEAQIMEAFLPDGKLQIDLITDDSRKAREGALFIAISGARRDGHVFLPDVAKMGAKAAIVERINPDVPIAQYRVLNSRRAWSSLSSAYYGHPSKDLFVYGITATNGKTTISFMLDEILRAGKLSTGLIGTVKIRIGGTVIPASMTTPESFELQGYFDQMKKAQVDTVTMEVSSSALEQYRAADVEFDVVSFNNFSREHIDQHGTLEAYWEAKASLITQARPETVTIINLSDPEVKKLSGQSKGQLVTYSADGCEGDIFPEAVDLSEGNPKFTLVVSRDIRLGGTKGRLIPAQRFPVELSTPGLHTVANAVACCAMALCGGLSLEAIRQGLKNFRGLERRFELIYDGEFKIIDDHFANMNNIGTSLRSLEGLSYSRLRMVYAIRGSRGVTVNRENVQALAKWLPRLKMDEIIVTETKGEVTAKDLVLPEEKAAFFEEIEKTGLKVSYHETMDDALGCALESVRPGDIIFLAGTQGMDMGGRKILNQLAEQDPARREEILAPVKDRICG